MSTVNVRAVLIGAGVALALVIPVVLVARVVVGDDDVAAGWQYLFAGYVLLSTLVGAAVAGRREPATPLFHGALAGLVTFVVAQVVSSIARAELPNLFAFVFFAVAFMSLGAIGGFVANAVGTGRGGGALKEGSP